MACAGVRSRRRAVSVGKGATAAAALALLQLTPRPAPAAELTQVASAFDQDHPFQLHLSLDYSFNEKEAAIEREDEIGTGASAAQPIPITKDLFYKETENLLTPRLDLGIFTDLQFHVAMPLVVSDDVSLGFDQRAGAGCVYPGQTTGNELPTCVNASNSTTLRDQILPVNMNGSYGFDAQSGGAAFGAGSSTVFRAPTRSGIQKILLGLDYAIFNEARDDTKPTWTLGAEYGLGVGQVMAFSREQPAANTGVDDGTDFIKLQTWLSRRHGVFDPYAGFWWLYPWARQGNGAPPYENYGRGDRSYNPRQQAGTVFGFETIAWEDPAAQEHVAIDAHGWLTAFFQGQGYSEMWEALADSPALAINGDGNGLPVLPYPGITTIQNYLSGGVDLGANAQLGSHVKLRLAGGLSTDQSHFITFTDAGVDLNNNGVVDPDKKGMPSPEVNPAYQPIIDLPGRRYLVVDVLRWYVLVQGKVLF